MNPRPYTEADWLGECKALVLYPEVWDLIWTEWDWAEAYVTGLSPVSAVRFALVDTLAPTVGEQTW